MPPRIPLQSLVESPWAIYPQALTRIVEWGRGLREMPDVLAIRGAPAPARPAGVVAVIPVHGVIEHRADMWTELFGGTAVDSLRDALRAAADDPAVQAIVLDVDSPGGTVAGVTELAAEIRDIRGRGKPIVAVANSFAASAAYWIASQADEVVASPSAQVGSVGVYAVHADISRALDAEGVTVTIVSAGPHKTEGNEFEPLSDEARADLQARVDTSYRTFVDDVAAGRRVASADVESKFGGGRVLTAKKAATAGMVDRVETLDQTVARLSSNAGRRRAMSAADDAPDLEAAEDAEGQTLMVGTTPAASTVAYIPPTFADRAAALAGEADALVAHANERARLRSKEGRPAFSTATERSLRSIRGAIEALLALDEPAASESDPVPDEPAPVVEPPPPAAPIPARFRSREDWLRYLEARH